jgi:hypothetical protein
MPKVGGAADVLAPQLAVVNGHAPFSELRARVAPERLARRDDDIAPRLTGFLFTEEEAEPAFVRFRGLDRLEVDRVLADEFVAGPAVLGADGVVKPTFGIISEVCRGAGENLSSKAVRRCCKYTAVELLALRWLWIWSWRSSVRFCITHSSFQTWLVVATSSSKLDWRSDSPRVSASDAPGGTE